MIKNAKEITAEEVNNILLNFDTDRDENQEKLIN